MRNRTKQSIAGLNRRDLLRSGGMTAAASLAAAAPSPATAAGVSKPDVYLRLGVRPFINTTATLTINGGSRMLPEVISAIEQASQFHVNLDELMEKAGARLAELLKVEWGIGTSGVAGGVRHATAACIAGSD